VDVTAEYQVPGLGNGIRKRLLAECKATKAPIDSTQWLKFLGKVLSEEKLHNEEVYGAFIALNGVNGNVQGHFNALRNTVKTISLIQGDDLLGVIRQFHSLVPLDQIAQLIKRLVERPYKDLDVAYYDKQFFWVAVFGNGEYALLRNDGGPVDEAVTLQIKPLIETELDAHKYLNIHEVAKAMAAKREIMSLVLGVLVANGGAAPLETVSVELKEHIASELEGAIGLLQSEGFLKRSGNQLSLEQMHEGQVEMGQRLKILRFMLEHGILVKALGSPLYDQMIDDVFLDELCKIHLGLKLSADDRQQVLRLLRWSPAGLARMLDPDPMIVQHRKNAAAVDARMDDHDRRYLLKALHDLLEHDYCRQGLQEYFCAVRGIREIESKESVIIKSKEGELHRSDIGQRIGIGPLAPGLGGGYLLVHLLPDSPPPWDWSRQTERGSNKQ
ncbi:MAG: hypothetical protein ACM359_24995, partial [Bacillota bacterium]